MPSKLFNDYVQKEVEILNARNFLITFYTQKAVANFDITDDTRALLKDMFYLFKKEYCLNFLDDNKIIENDQLAFLALYGEQGNVPFEDIDEKEFKELMKLSKATEKNMTKTLDKKQDNLYQEIYGFWSADSKAKQDRCFNNQISSEDELCALLKSATESYEVYLVEERTPLKKIKDFIEPLTTRANKSYNQEFGELNTRQTRLKDYVNPAEKYNDGYDNEYDDGYEL